MSSSGNATGVTTMYVRDAQDITLQLKRRLVHMDSPRINHVPNANENYLVFLLGRSECAHCIGGSPFIRPEVRVFR